MNGFGWLVSWSANGVTLNDDRTGPAEAKTMELEITDAWYDDK